MCKLFVAPDDLEEMARTADRLAPIRLLEAVVKCLKKITVAGVPKKVLSQDLLQSWRVDIWVRTADCIFWLLGYWVIGLLGIGRSTREEHLFEKVMRRKLIL